eukprot:1160745-Pelagomonas_calceolata.AAC.17
MDNFCAVGTVEQAEQPKYLAEVSWSSVSDVGHWCVHARILAHSPMEKKVTLHNLHTLAADKKH